MKHKSYKTCLRITFSYKGSNIRTISHQRVKMKPFPSDTLHAVKDQSGFWYELRGSGDKILYRRVIKNPIVIEAEVRSDNSERPLNWEGVSDPKGSFVLLMPYKKEAQTLVLFSSPPETGRSGKPAREIYRLDLSKEIWDKERGE